jgi:putative transposase
LIPEEDERRVWRYIETVARDQRCDVLAVGGMPDHLHLLVNFNNMVSMSDFMKSIKGSSSRFISQELKPDGFFKWQAHFGAKAVCPDALDNCVRYINNQKQHHAEGTTISDWERTFIDYDVPDEAHTS